MMLAGDDYGITNSKKDKDTDVLDLLSSVNIVETP